MFRQFTSLTAQTIPQESGIYAFFYNPFEPSRLGIYVDQPQTKETVRDALTRLKRKLEIYTTICSQQELGIHTELKTPGGLLAWTTQSFTSPRLASDIIEDLSILNPRDTVRALRTMAAGTSFQSPLYVGMTARQGLYTRYHQHHIDYSAENPGTFGKRLAETGAMWSDIDFFCQTEMYESSNNESIRAAESALITLTAPRLNARS